MKQVMDMNDVSYQNIVIQIFHYNQLGIKI